MSDQERANLTRDQTETLTAILSREPDAFAHAAEVLRCKRRREAMLAAPRLTELLGTDFTARFDEYAGQVGYPRRGGPIADAASFGRHLLMCGLLPDEAKRENLVLCVRSGRRWRIGLAGRKLLLAYRLCGSVHVISLF